MAEDTPNPFAPTKTDPPAPQPPTATESTATRPPEDDDDRPDDVAAMRKALKKANGEAEKYRRQWQELADKDKTELQRATERAETAEREAQAAAARALRVEVAVEKGLPANLAGRLQGNTREELETDADELLTLAGTPKPRTRRDPDQGRRDASTDDTPDMNDWMRRASKK